MTSNHTGGNYKTELVKITYRTNSSRQRSHTCAYKAKNVAEAGRESRWHLNWKWSYLWYGKYKVTENLKGAFKFIQRTVLQITQVYRYRDFFILILVPNSVLTLQMHVHSSESKAHLAPCITSKRRYFLSARGTEQHQNILQEERTKTDKEIDRVIDILWNCFFFFFF